MISEQNKDKLKENWGEKADGLDCLAYVKVVGAERDWACFIFAMNPENEDEVMTITRDFHDYEIMEWSVKDLFALYNKEGEYVYVDKEYKPKNVKTLLVNVWKY
jgi:hypothetical protein